MSSAGEFWVPVICIAAFIFAVWVYFLPTFKAMKVKHPDENSIFVLNLLLGWLLIPWVITLAWAYKTFPQREVTADQKAPDAQGDDHKSCPFCAETILSKAVKCRYCGSELPASTAAI
jgi:heme/copper-type cytochrome/quinol oxidase subunit 2